MKRICFFLFLFCGCCASLSTHAQSIEAIKNDANYVWGEGTGVTTDEAEKAALAQMSRSITVNVYDKTIDADNNGTSLQKSILQAVSSARLQNVQKKVLSPEPNARIFCFMQRNEVKKMLKQKEDKIIDFVETGRKAEERLQIDDALRCYYWALLLSRTGTDPEITFGNEKGLASVLLPVKIKSMIQLLKANVIGGSIENQRLKAQLQFTYNGKPVSSLQFNYNDGQGIVGPIVVKDGVGEADMVATPGSGKIYISYETRFRMKSILLTQSLVRYMV